MIEVRAEASGEIRGQFGRDGYLLARSFLSGEALRELERRLAAFLRGTVARLDPGQVFYEDRDDPSTLKQIQQLGHADPWFRGLQERGSFRALAEQLLEGPVRPVNLQYFSKPPGRGAPTPPHQDGFYFLLDRPAALTLWLALDPVDEENGCVRYVEGSHLEGMRPHARTRTLGFSQGLVDYPRAGDAERERAMCARPGDLLAHHALTIHRAEANLSSRPRRALGFIYYAADAREDRAAHEAYQERLRKELREEGKIR